MYQGLIMSQLLNEEVLSFVGGRIRQAGLSFEAMFEEVPILIRNSHLVNALLCEIEEETPSETKYNFLDLSTR